MKENASRYSDAIRSLTHGILKLIAAVALLGSLPLEVRAVEADDAQNQSALNKTFPVARFLIVYHRDHPANPPVDSLYELPISLGVSEKGYTVPDPEGKTEQLSLKDLNSGSTNIFSGSAIQHIASNLLANLNESGLVGVWVGVHPDDINSDTGADLRNDKSLRLLIQTTTAGQVRTVARGDRFKDKGTATNHPAHSWIREGSPILPGASWESSDLLDREALNAYAQRLSRHPSRRVDLAVSPIEDTNGVVALDYIIFEPRPWTLWARFANTGTDQTDKWRETFGLQHNQLIGLDDQLDVIYSTAGFDNAHSVDLTYERPVSLGSKTSVRLSAGYNEYKASDVGFDELGFEGNRRYFGVSVLRNVKQDGPLFVDLVLGVDFQDDHVDNGLSGTTGRGEFVLPFVGLELERNTRFGRTFGNLDLRYSTRAVSDEDIEPLGRSLADDQFALLSLYMTHSFFLERVFDFGDTLAHEVELTAGGQTSFRKRLPSSFQQTIGGMHTLRGYPESKFAGDRVAYGSLEYRFHVPQYMGFQADPGEGPFHREPFRYLPQHRYGVTDLDLALKAFTDVAWVDSTDKLSFETENALASVGIGVDFRYKRNAFITVDWGVALVDAEEENVSMGDNRASISFTFMY